jgi:large subunit ribosomal protein L30
MAKTIKVQQIKSSIGALQPHKLTLKALGLRRIGHAKVYNESPALLGMINAVKHLVKVEEVKEGTK